MSKKKKQKIDLSPYENREALCPHFGLCGGCTYQKIAYEDQLNLKKTEVQNLLSGICDPDEEVFEGIIGSPKEQGYRNKMEFTFGDAYKDGPFALGMHQKGSFFNIVDLTDCRLIHDDLNKIRNTVRDFFNVYYEKKRIDFHHKHTHEGWLRHLLVRRAAKTGEILVALVTDSAIRGGRIAPTEEPLDEQAVLADFVSSLQGLKLEGELVGILHIVNDSLSDAVKSDRTEILFGRDFIYDEVLGLRFKISVFSFFQTNTLGAEVLYDKVREYAADAHGRLFDLYSGTGTITQLMSPVVNEAVGVEIVEEAVEAAKENAVLNGIHNVRFVAADVLKAVDTLGQPDSLILDPPREGVHPKALGKILSWGVERIVYVSCKPASLARDLESFQIAGYQIEKMCCVDMFPQTVHVETVVLMSRVDR